jgi:hypothetical protein
MFIRNILEETRSNVFLVQKYYRSSRLERQKKIHRKLHSSYTVAFGIILKYNHLAKTSGRLCKKNEKE